ncbi:MAG: flagellar filament capping protein FliD [Vibrio sp.]
MSVGPLGMNGGMDINSMVQKIVSSERVPKQKRIDNERADVNASISAYGRLKESLDSMKNLMSDFRFNKVFAARKVDVTDDSAVIAKASTNAIAGKYSVDVLQLAQSHKLASTPFDDRQKFGPGKLHVSMGNRSFDVNVSSYSKINDVVRGINGAKSNPGVRAAVIKDSNGPRIVIAANQTGKDSSLSISVDAKPGDALNQLAFKTLADRVKDLESARAEAQEILQPLTPKQQEVASKVAQKIESAARKVDQETADANENSANTPLTSSGKTAQPYVKPQDRIPGWTETASGTLLDSYEEPQPELDSNAQAKSSQVPGWSNTASGTLYDSYVTPEEAEKKLTALRQDEERDISQAVKSGNMTPEEAKAAIRAQMSPEEKQQADKIDQAQKNLQAAQAEFDNYNGLTQVQTAQDSKVILDGVATLSSNNNVIEDAIEGVDLTLKAKTDPNARPPEIDVEYDRETVSQYLEKFVNAYNQFHQVNKELGSVDPRTGRAGPLAGESITRSAESRLKSVFSTPIEGAPKEMNSLSSLGITTTRQGGLELNREVLNRQLVNNFDKLKGFFGGRDGFADRIQDAIQSVTGVTGAIRTREKSLTEENRRLQDDQATLDRRMDQLKTRTHAKFEAMQDATSKMQSQLTGMMNALG